MVRILNIFAPVVLVAVAAVHAAAPSPPAYVAIGNSGKLVYVTDERGDRVPDFSYCGYRIGEVAIPDAPVRVLVPRRDGDNTARIQAAIDYVASLQPRPNGLRGAVLLENGRYRIDGGLKIAASGVVLRGQGAGEGGTVLFAAGQDRRTVIRIMGVDDRKLSEKAVAVADHYAPVHSTRLGLADAGSFKVGDTVLVRRPCTAEWIKALGMDNMGGERHAFSWKPGSRELAWDRTVTAVKEKQITLDGPITTAIDAEMGGGNVVAYSWPGRISNVGVENLRCESAFDEKNPKDEEHAWFGVAIENAADAWVRQVTFAHFAGSTVAVFDSCKRVTIEDCKSLAPVSEIAGERRHTFFVAGQQVLVQRCYTENGRHDFATGFCAAGPIAFVQCEANDALDESGPIDSWASGVLYDNVRIDGNMLSFRDRAFRLQGAGWSAANCVAWQCSAAVINSFSPPGAANWVMGSTGQFGGDGRWYGLRESIKPTSLFYAQLAERIGPDAMKRADIMMTPSDSSSSPEVDVAAKLTAAAKQPGPLLSDWIDQAAERHPIPTDAAGAKSVDDVPAATQASSPAPHRMAIDKGVIKIDGEIAHGGRQRIKWWAGGVRPDDIEKPEPSPTRFVPGRIGAGLTDDLDQLTDQMRKDGKIALEHHYGLWYDTRDADHERMRRMDGDVTPPFYEYPFARSGVGVAWDGLSQYDLTKYNAWYFSRLKEFAGLCDRKGLVLIQQHFFQHNIIEAGAHWASCPWRSANNINNTGFPEPPNYAGDKRVFMAEQFYDVNHPVRRQIYRAYIRHCLDNLADNANVIHLTSAEYTGPLHFMQFWLDTIAEWEKETGKHPTIGLAATKDVQDAILADATRAAVVDVIDIRYWYYQADGSAYAPKGGLSLAPRQHARLLKPKATSAEQVERAVREYREKYPDKAVLFSTDDAPRFAPAARNAGASLAP